jgi:hypothetical protein
MLYQRPMIFLLCVLSTWALCQETRWDFEQDTSGWRALENSIRIEREVGPDGRTALHVHGRSKQGWNYARSAEHPITAGKKYRFSAWMKVNALGPGIARPVMKCEFERRDGGGEVGRVFTNPYEMFYAGRWRMLTIEFQVPEGVDGCWFAIVKPNEEPAEVDLLLDDARLEEIKQFNPFHRYSIDLTSRPIEKKREQHPRLFLDNDRITALRGAVEGTHKNLWQELRMQAEAKLAEGPPAYQARQSDKEQLWQREAGNTLPTLAMAWLITEDHRFLDGVRVWAEASCNYPTWGLGDYEGVDLAAAHQLFGLAVVYDWCYHDLDPSVRERIKNTLAGRAAFMATAAARGDLWWEDFYLQNHLWVNACAVATAGLALYEEGQQPAEWIGFALRKFQIVADALPADGGSHEGVGYWGYGLEHLGKFSHLAQDLLGVDLYQSPWFQRTAEYRLYMALPRQAWSLENNSVDFADSPRHDWYGPDYTLRHLAGINRDPHAQWLAQEIDAANMTGAASRWLNLLWFDPTLEAQGPTALPTLRHFEDMGLVTARSDWSGQESMLAFSCGPFIGKHAVTRFRHDPGGGHAHPDAGHFVLFANGEWLVRDDGYQDKWTGQHNTLLIDDLGQMGEGSYRFEGNRALRLPAQPTCAVRKSTHELDHIVGDATAAYPPELGLKRYIRHLLFLKPHTLIVIDDIEVKERRSLELRFHPEQEALEEDDAGYLMRGKNTRLRIQPLTPDGVHTEARRLSGSLIHGKGLRMFTLRLKKKARSWRNATAFTWGGSLPESVQFSEDGNRWRFEAGKQQMTFDWSTGDAVGTNAENTGKLTLNRQTTYYLTL